MMKTYRYRLRPTKSQITILEKHLDLCRWVYNNALAYRKQAWYTEHLYVQKYETQSRLPFLKLHKPELYEVNAQTLQNVVHRVELAFSGFFVESD